MEDGSTAATAGHATIAPRCVHCGTALAGPFGALFRLVGINRAARNPKLYMRCNIHAEEGRVVEVTALLADLSGFTVMTRKPVPCLPAPIPC